MQEGVGPEAADAAAGNLGRREQSDIVENPTQRSGRAQQRGDLPTERGLRKGPMPTEISPVCCSSAT
jgi:hypothetical protein